MKRTFLALLAVGLLALGLYWVKGDDHEIISRDQALRMARQGDVLQIEERSDRQTIVLTPREGGNVRVQWIADEVERLAFYRAIDQAAPNDVGFSPGPPPGGGFWLGSGVVAALWVLYLLVPIAVVDVVMLVRRSGRGWESPDVLWLVAIILLAPLGSVAWLIAGRRVRGRERRSPPPPSTPTWQDDPRIVAG